jgi:hypothetical protein
LCRQQRVYLRCITITRGFPKLLPRHSPLPPFVRVRQSIFFLPLSLIRGKRKKKKARGKREKNVTNKCMRSAYIS